MNPVDRDVHTATGHVLDDVDTQGALSQLIDAEFIRRSPDEPGVVQFQESVVRTTLMAMLSHSQRTTLHSLALRALQELQLLDPSYELDLCAEHAALSIELIGETEAVQICLAAGNAAIDRFDWRVAERHFRTALGVAGKQIDVATKTRLLEGLGVALLNITDPFTSERAVEFLNNAFDGYIEAEEPENALRVASLPFPAIPQRSSVANLIMRGLQFSIDDPAASSRLLGRLSAFNAIAEGDIEGACQSAGEAVTQAERSGDPRAISLAYAHVAQVAAHAFRVEEAIDAAGSALTGDGASIEPVAAILANHSVALAHMFAGHIEEAVWRAEAAVVATDAVQDDHRKLGLMWLLVRLHMDSGDFQGAVGVSDEALEIHPSSPIHLGLRAWLEFEMGNDARGWSFLERQMAVESEPNPAYGLAPAGIRTLMLTMIARLTGDRDVLQSANRAAAATMSRGFGTPFQRIDAFQISARLVALQNDRFTASQLLSEYQAVASDFDVPGTFWHAAAEVHKLAGLPEQAQALYEDSYKFVESSGQRLLFVYLCQDYIQFLLERSDAESLARARDLVTKSLDRAMALRLTPHIETLTLLKHRIAATEKSEGLGINGLSVREREVLELIATGLPNAEIAGRLDLSEHTVHSHVSSILGKLGVHSRTQAALLAQSDLHG